MKLKGKKKRASNSTLTGEGNPLACIGTLEVQMLLYTAPRKQNQNLGHLRTTTPLSQGDAEATTRAGSTANI
jgi:hypothetical protein